MGTGLGLTRARTCNRATGGLILYVDARVPELVNGVTRTENLAWHAEISFVPAPERKYCVHVS